MAGKCRHKVKYWENGNQRCGCCHDYLVMKKILKKPAIIMDLDGTLANCDHRRHHAKEGDFGQFYKKIPEDSLNEWASEICFNFRKTHDIVIVTGREWTKKVADRTVNWLGTNNIYYDRIFHRKEKDYRPDS